MAETIGTFELYGLTWQIDDARRWDEVPDDGRYRLAHFYPVNEKGERQSKVTVRGRERKFYGTGVIDLYGDRRYIMAPGDELTESNREDIRKAAEEALKLVPANRLEPLTRKMRVQGFAAQVDRFGAHEAVHSALYRKLRFHRQGQLADTEITREEREVVAKSFREAIEHELQKWVETGY